MNHAVHTPLHSVQLPCLAYELHQQALLLLFTPTSAAMDDSHEYHL